MYIVLQPLLLNPKISFETVEYWCRHRRFSPCLCSFDSEPAKTTLSWNQTRYWCFHLFRVDVQKNLFRQSSVSEYQSENSGWVGWGELPWSVALWHASSATNRDTFLGTPQVHHLPQNDKNFIPIHFNFHKIFSRDCTGGESDRWSSAAGPGQKGYKRERARLDQVKWFF